MKPLTIRASLIAWFVGLAGLLLIAFSFTLYITMDRTLRADLDLRLDITARGLVALCDWDESVDYVECELSEELVEMLAANHPDMSQEIWTWPDPWRIHESGKTIETPLPDPTWKAEADLTQGPVKEFATVEGPAGRQRLCTMLVHSPADPEEPEESQAFTVLIRVAENLAPIDAQLSQLGWIVVILAGMAVVVVIFFAILLSRRVVKPLKALGKAAAEIQAGSAAKLPRRGVGDEVDNLGDVLEEAFLRLEDALQRQTRFTSDAAHELRNPIAVIQNAAEIALRRDRTGEEYQGFFSDVLATSRRMGQVVEALLLLARLDAGTAGHPFERIDLVALARDSAAGQHLMKNRVIIIAERAIFVEGDEGLLRVLVDNLLSNALRYSGPDAEVTVTVEEKEGVTLRVQDQGPGIPSDAVGRVFDRFYRVENANPDAPGAGLGLALVAEVARVHSLESRIDTSKRGTCVIVRFPSAPPIDLRSDRISSRASQA